MSSLLSFGGAPVIAVPWPGPSRLKIPRGPGAVAPGPQGFRFYHCQPAMRPDSCTRVRLKGGYREDRVSVTENHLPIRWDCGTRPANNSHSGRSNDENLPFSPELAHSANLAPSPTGTPSQIGPGTPDVAGHPLEPPPLTGSNAPDLVACLSPYKKNTTHIRQRMSTPAIIDFLPWPTPFDKRWSAQCGCPCARCSGQGTYHDSMRWINVAVRGWGVSGPRHYLAESTGV